MSFESDKDNLFHEFFNVGGHPDKNVRINTINDIKFKLLKMQTVKQDDYEIKFMINVIECLIIWMKEDDKVKAREKVTDIWNIFTKMDTFTLYDIRILTAILFSAKTLEEFILLTNKALEQLEKYSDHHIYLHTKTILNNNLSYILMKAKYMNDKEYSSALDNLLFESTINTLDLSMKYDNFLFPRALARKGIITKDKTLIYAGLSMLNTSESKDEIQFIRDFDIFFVTHRSIL